MPDVGGAAAALLNSRPRLVPTGGHGSEPRVLVSRPTPRHLRSLQVPAQWNETHHTSHQR